MKICISKGILALIHIAIAVAILIPHISYAQMDHNKMNMGDMGMRSSAGKVVAPENYHLAIGRMKVTLMPEYDSSNVLVIQEGKFVDRTAFPNIVSFVLPNEITKLTDVCSLSPGGHHFCQIFEIKSANNSKYMDIKLPFSDFFIDYQYAPFQVKENSKRNFTYTINTRYDVNVLEVNVQEPYRAEDFNVSPAMTQSYEKNGFNYKKHIFRDIKAGDVKMISISYFKKDARPSVDIKFSVMSSPSVFSGNTGEMVLGVGVFSLIALWYLRRKRFARGNV